MSFSMNFKRIYYLVLLITLLSIFLFRIPTQKNALAKFDAASLNTHNTIARVKSSVSTSNSIFLPLIVRNDPWQNPFGIESNRLLMPGSLLLQRAIDLKTGWARLNSRISWRQLQPTEDSPILWDKLTDFESELGAIKATNLTPVVIINDYPRWATINNVRKDLQPTSCGPIRADKFDAFARFVSEVVARYKTSAFNVHNWEFGNEPDVDPNLVPPDNVFGCWGNIDDEFYGGRYYGEMLKAVGPRVKAEDPTAHIWIGGLLLSVPDSSGTGNGRPELFLKGILEANAASYFDVIPYHWYPTYWQGINDYDTHSDLAWDSWGGGVIGKASFLRQIMGQYNVDKPLFLNETAFGCQDSRAWCVNPDDQFYQLQADLLVRMFTRGISVNLMGAVWYTLDGPGWWYTGLLDGNTNPKPSYNAYQQLTIKLYQTLYIGPVNYGDTIEAYAFRQLDRQIHVLWTKVNQSTTITVPAEKFIAAYSRDGIVINGTLVGSYYVIPVGFSPIYIVRNP